MKEGAVARQWEMRLEVMTVVEVWTVAFSVVRSCR
jgi:hypothetical protein